MERCGHGVEHDDADNLSLVYGYPVSNVTW